MKYTLENVNVENPCPMTWESMSGSDEIRHCNKCRRDIYNISEMPKRRALKVLNQGKDSICISYQRNEQNQIITQNYFGIFKRNLTKVASAILAVLIGFTSIHALQTKNSKPKKKKVVKQRNYKKRGGSSNVNPARRVVGPAGNSKKKIIGLLQ